MKTYLDCVADWPAFGRASGYRARALARLCDVSLRQLERYFVERMHSTPQRWLDDLQRQEARRSREPSLIRLVPAEPLPSHAALLDVPPTLAEGHAKPLRARLRRDENSGTSAD